MALSRRRSLLIPFLGSAACAWYLFYPHLVTIRSLYGAPQRYSGRMVSVRGMLLTNGDSEYFAIAQQALNEHEVYVGVAVQPPVIMTTSSRLAFLEFIASGSANQRIRQVGVIRSSQMPAHVIGILTYSDKACFSSGFTVHALYLSLDPQGLLARAERLPRTGRRPSL